MRTKFRLLLLAFFMLGIATSCRSPTDSNPTPEEEEEEGPGGKDPSAFAGGVVVLV